MRSRVESEGDGDVYRGGWLPLLRLSTSRAGAREIERSGRTLVARGGRLASRSPPAPALVVFGYLLPLVDGLRRRAAFVFLEQSSPACPDGLGKEKKIAQLGLLLPGHVRAGRGVRD